MLPIAWDTITRIVPTIKVRQRKCTRAITHTPYVYGIPRSKILIHAKTRMMLNFLATSFFYIYVMATSFFYIYIDIYIDIYKLTECPAVLLNAIFDLAVIDLFGLPALSPLSPLSPLVRCASSSFWRLLFMKVVDRIIFFQLVLVDWRCWDSNAQGATWYHRITITIWHTF